MSPLELFAVATYLQWLRRIRSGQMKLRIAIMHDSSTGLSILRLRLLVADFFEQKTIAKLNAAKVNRNRRAYLQSSSNEAQLLKQLDQLFVRLRIPKPAQSSDSEPPKQVATTTYRILRDTALVLRVKQRHSILR